MPGWFSVAFFLCAFFLLPFLISWLLTASLLRLAPRFGLFDEPNVRKVHTRRTPKGGGLAIYVAMGISAFFLPHGRHGDALRVLALGLVIVLLGLIDDLRSLPWQLRLGTQTAVAVVAVFSMPSDLAWFVRVGAVVWIVGLTNAFNMLDNMDALSAGVAWMAAGLLAAASMLRPEGDWQAALPYFVFMGALSGFLWFNRPPARIFMGDAGSTFLGFFLGFSSLEGSIEDLLMPQWLAVPLCILAVPWYDIASVVALRLWQGRSPFHADKQHLSHRLVQLGLKSPLAVCVIYLLALASGAGGLLLYQVSAIGASLVAVQLAGWWLAIAAIEYIGHYRSRGSRQGDKVTR
jgi:UDP-GlcNAc:undecaprenyl-phosphate GlcNAc-1-phosphate transferase